MINHHMNMGDVKIFSKNENELEALIGTVRIYSKDYYD